MHPAVGEGDAGWGHESQTGVILQSAASMTRRQILEQRLVLAKSHIAAGQRHLHRQRRFLAQLVCNGHDTVAALHLLASLERAHRSNLADRDRAAEELKLN
jgi:hypothetical protein